MRTAKLGTGDIQEHQEQEHQDQQEQEHQEYQEQEHQKYQGQEHHWHQHRRKDHSGDVVTSFAFMRPAELGTGRDIQERNRGTKGFPISSLCQSVPFLKGPDHVFSDRG